MIVQSSSPPIPICTLRMNNTEIQNLVLTRIRLKKPQKILKTRATRLFIKTQIAFQLYLLINTMPKHPLKIIGYISFEWFLAVIPEVKNLHFTI